MITKQCAMQLYNLHRQIESSNEIINVLKQVQGEAEKNEQGIEIIGDNWHRCQTIELSIPDRFKNPNGSSFNSSTIYQISCSDAILVLENHIIRLTKALEAEQKKHWDKFQDNTINGCGVRCSTLGACFFVVGKHVRQRGEGQSLHPFFKSNNGP